MQNFYQKRLIDGSLANMGTVDDLASEIGEHFKKLIDFSGSETCQSIIPSVVQALEYLEQAVLERNSCLMQIDSLHLQIEDLQKENHQRIQQQIKYQSEIEDIDEMWRKENAQLSQYVKYLRNENKRLINTVKVNEKFSHSLSDLKPDDIEEKTQHGANPFQMETLSNAQIDKLKNKIRLLNEQIDLKNDEIDNLKIQNENQTKENENLRSIISLSLSVKKISVIDSSIEATEYHLQQEHQNSAKLIDGYEDKIRKLEQEISLYKTRLELMRNQQQSNYLKKNDDNDDINKQDTNNNKTNQESNKTVFDDLPVQGPIPQEPEEKLHWPYGRTNRDKSRFWSFFRTVLRN